MMARQGNAWRIEVGLRNLYIDYYELAAIAGVAKLIFPKVMTRSFEWS